MISPSPVRVRNIKTGGKRPRPAPSLEPRRVAWAATGERAFFLARLLPQSKTYQGVDLFDKNLYRPAHILIESYRRTLSRVVPVPVTALVVRRRRQRLEPDEEVAVGSKIKGRG